MKTAAPTEVVSIAGTFADEAALAAGLTTSTGVMIAFFDRELRIGWCNERYAEWFALPPSALVGRRIAEVYGQAAFAEALPRLQRALSGQHVRYERLLEKPGTTPKWISISLHPHRGEDGEVLGLFACSIEVDEGAMRELREGRELRNRVIVRNLTRGGRALYGEWFHSAFVDRHGAMTGCHNRAYLIHRIEQAIERAQRHGETPALLYLDLDRFKPVNDRHGHAAGDALLKEVAHRLRDCVRTTDCVARVGGDEFVVLMDGRVEPGMAEALRDRIAARLGEGFWIHGHALSIGASIGLARFPADGDSADALLRAADERMYGEKRGR